MRPGSANRPGARTVSVRSPGGDFGIFPRSPAQTTSGPSTTIAAFSSTRSPSKNPSTSNTVRIATQYRPAMPGALIERLRARGFVLPDYEGGGLLNVAASVLDLLGARDDTDPPPLRALDPALCEGVRQVVVVLADGLGTGQFREDDHHLDRKSTRLNSSHVPISYAVFCLKKKKTITVKFEALVD